MYVAFTNWKCLNRIEEHHFQQSSVSILQIERYYWNCGRYMYMYVSLYEGFNIFHGWCGVWFHSYHARLEVIRAKKLPCGGRLHFLVGQKQSSSHLCCGNFLDGENRSDHKESFQHVTNHWQVCNNASTPYQELQSNSELTVVTWYNQNDLLLQ
jgi:hypothetical protein